jgi:formylglycine-generating enzyme required for sulfatase activity
VLWTAQPLQYSENVRVFVCHASEDKARVRQLCNQLRDDGFEPWLDEEQLLPGQDWEREITTAVRGSDAILVCLSKFSVEKVGFVQKELRRIVEFAEYQPEHRIFVIPVRLEPCSLPASLSKWQNADLFSPDGYEKLRQSLRGLKLSPSPDPTETPARPTAEPRIGKRSVMIAGVLIALGIIGWLWAAYPHRNPSPATPQQPRNAAVPAGMVAIPGGRFLMGKNDSQDPESSPAHFVEVKPFLIDRVPVTNSLYRDFLRASNRLSPQRAAELGGDNRLPVTRVTWDEAASYCLAQDKRLPSEAEWEFAARATDGRLYPWGDTFSDSATNSLESHTGHAEPVEKRAANRSPFQVADMSGNVWQWCADDYRPYPGRVARFAVPDSAKVIRGGSYQSDRLHVTAVTRNLERPSTASAVIGFRCAK